MLNMIAIMGRLVSDPVQRQTGSGRRVASFRIACDRPRKGPDGQRPADFFDVVAWEQMADFVCRYFRKGSLVAVDGRLQCRAWQDDAGSKRQVVEIVANSCHFTGERQDDARRAAPAPAAAAPAALPPAEDGDGFVLIGDEGDLPF